MMINHATMRPMGCWIASQHPRHRRSDPDDTIHESDLGHSWLVNYGCCINYPIWHNRNTCLFKYGNWWYCQNRYSSLAMCQMLTGKIEQLQPNSTTGKQVPHSCFVRCVQKTVMKSGGVLALVPHFNLRRCRRHTWTPSYFFFFSPTSCCDEWIIWRAQQHFPCIESIQDSEIMCWNQF